MAVFFSDSLAVPVIFRGNNGVLVRDSSGNVVSKPGIAELLDSVPSSGGASARATQNIDIGTGSSPAELSRSISAGDLAGAAAEAILSKSLPGLVATLALPYIIDSATDSLMRQTEGPPVSSGGIGTCRVGAGGNVTKAQCYASWNKTIVSETFRTSGCSYGTWSAKYYNSGNSGSTSTTDAWCPGPAQTCTAPSHYDSATGMCIGSLINEPANAQQLANDIAETFSGDPNKAPQVLDEIINNNPDVPISALSPTVITNDPPSVPGETTQEVRNGFDPSTGHPTTTTTTTENSYKPNVEPGTSTVNIQHITNTTTNIYDSVTNTTVTTSSNSSSTPGPASTNPGDGQTDCDKYPESIGCSHYGDIPTADTIPQSNAPLSLSPSSWGSGSCPADYNLDVHSPVVVGFSYAPICTYLSSLAPVLIAVGWLMAGWMVIGGVKD